jgi:phosphomannomutase
MENIKFGTDGWRGIIAKDFTFDRVELVSAIAAEVLAKFYGHVKNNRLIIVGYDRRFMAEKFALTAAESIQKAGFDVLLSETFAPTPAFSLAANQLEALGAIVITASHNPAAYLGLKIKGAFGGSVPPEVTKEVEAKLSESVTVSPHKGTLKTFNPWVKYCKTLRSKVQINDIKQAIIDGKLKVFADVMHGAAASGLEQILNLPITEVNSNSDPLFDGGAPEPLPRYLSQLFRLIRAEKINHSDGLRVGLVFDGDSDRIAAVDGEGKFLSSQILIPILINHLATNHQKTGEIVKTVSGSDIMPLVAKLHNLPVYETAVGYKYIADRMLSNQVLLGGEESGGIGYGDHIPERDALLSALYVLEAVVKSGKDLGELYQELRVKTNFYAEYDRIDLHLSGMELRAKLLQQLENQPLTEIAGKKVIDCNKIDGYKFRLADESWLMIRFSGTEPVLRLYCEAANIEEVHKTLKWAANWAQN